MTDEPDILPRPLSALRHFTLSGDENGGVSLVCSDCTWTPDHPERLTVAYYGHDNTYDNYTEVKHVKTVTKLIEAGLTHVTQRHAEVSEPSQETISSLVAASPNIGPELVQRMRHVIRQIEKALQDTRMNEPAQAWLRTMLRTCHGEDWDEGVVGKYLRGEVKSTLDYKETNT